MKEISPCAFIKAVRGSGGIAPLVTSVFPTEASSQAFIGLSKPGEGAPFAIEYGYG